MQGKKAKGERLREVKGQLPTYFQIENSLYRPLLPCARFVRNAKFAAQSILDESKRKIQLRLLALAGKPVLGFQSSTFCLCPLALLCLRLSVSSRHTVIKFWSFTFIL